MKEKKTTKTQGRSLAISVKELAEKLSLSSRTIWRLGSSNKLPKMVSIGGSKRFLMSDVDLFLECGCDMAAYNARKEDEKC
jgi:excisionase family DNA binding protein